MNDKKGMYKGIRVFVNPDVNYANEVKQSLKANDGYCPCRKEKTPDTKCMCKEFREQKKGYCHCGLYYKEI